MFGAELPAGPYFEHAIQYYRNKFPDKAVFVAASDDPQFIRQKLKKYEDVVFSPGAVMNELVALVNSCLWRISLLCNLDTVLDLIRKKFDRHIIFSY